MAGVQISILMLLAKPDFDAYEQQEGRLHFKRLDVGTTFRPLR